MRHFIDCDDTVLDEVDGEGIPEWIEISGRAPGPELERGGDGDVAGGGIEGGR